ncbi:hypothetical protein OG874_30200 [Nocardia sp. NBC_00565]|uniref:hypothetical protein n=1 Tax=Nocardia sp. NBC_00565 TaxID=2975993 RepID=UPI002E81D93D|nr:hypothetical protein [Nocardia sp. NBC_00565]WUC01073.1 hypothetical protein OG874_30200 [Nocardia sp. NBC_00565]
MPNRELPQRDPFTGPPATYSGAQPDLVEQFAVAVRGWASPPATAEPSRCRGVDAPGTGRTNRDRHDQEV